MNQKAREKAPTKTRLIHEPFSRRDRIMRWSAWLLFFSFGLIGCGSEMHQKIKLDIPAYSPLKLEEYKEIVLVPFLLEENKKEEAPSAKESGPSGPEEAKAKKEGHDWKAAAELVPISLPNCVAVFPVRCEFMKLLLPGLTLFARRIIGHLSSPRPHPRLFLPAMAASNKKCARLSFTAHS